MDHLLYLSDVELRTHRTNQLNQTKNQFYNFFSERGKISLSYKFAIY